MNDKSLPSNNNNNNVTTSSMNDSEAAPNSSIPINDGAAMNGGGLTATATTASNGVNGAVGGDVQKQGSGAGSTTVDTVESSQSSSLSMSFLQVTTSSGMIHQAGHNPEDDGESVLIVEDDLAVSLLPQNNASTGERGSSTRAIREYFDHCRKLGPYLATISILSMIILIPMVIYRAASLGRFDVGATETAAVMMVGTLIMSFRLVYLHLTHWYAPDVQKYVVRILWMVPIYAVQSWLSLVYTGSRIYIDAIRDFYEAYVIASFVYYLMELLGGQDQLVILLQNKNDPSLGEHHFPFNYILAPWEMGMEFMLQCKHGALQYVVMKFMATLLTFVCQWLDVYGDGEFSWASAYPYMTFFMNFSVMYALYCLVMLYHAVQEDLRHPVNWKPLGKFLCIKGVVFFTWWQGVLIHYLRSEGIIQGVQDYSSETIANMLIDYCICVEMVFFAIAHSYSFSYKEYLPQRRRRAQQQQEQQRLEAEAPDTVNHDNSNNNHTADDGDDNDDCQEQSYHPPTIRTLEQPLSFQDAFWSSTVPSETLNDIQRLRGGVDRSLQQALSPGSISLREMAGGDMNELERQTENFV